MQDFKYIFGPVRSSRLGLSLGLDLTGDRICSFDCLYCESGKTRVRTIQRQPLAPADQIRAELESRLEAGLPGLDCITLGGPGEPTLNSSLGAILRQVNRTCPDMPTAVLTNSSLLNQARVRDELCLADIVLPSLDSVVEQEFRKVNRPHPDIRLEEIIQGLLDFRAVFQGKIYLEVLLLPGINDSDRNIAGLREFTARFRPDRVDVTTMTRPGAYLTEIHDDSFLDKVRKKLCIQTASARNQSKILHASGQLPGEILSMIASSIRIRPQTQAQLSTALNIPEQDVARALKELVSQGRAEEVQATHQQKKFYISRG
ncbi:MAG: radical SAM protein [Desulfonatronovibrionaceae bacterium]